MTVDVKAFVAKNLNTIVVVLSVCGAGLLAFSREFRLSALAQAALLVLSAISFVCLRRLREIRGEDHRKHGVATGWWHLATTNLAAFAYAWFMYDGYGRGHHEATGNFDVFGSAAKDWMLASGVVGGTLAIFRSSGTNSAALAALRQNELLRDQVAALQRKLVDASDLTALALDAAQAVSVEALLPLLQSMVTTAADLPETSDGVDAFSVWIREDDAWRVLAGRGVSEGTLAQFRQPVLARVEAGKGIVANMAASGQRQFITAANAYQHEWFAANPNSTRTTEGFAAILLVDQSDAPCGALCLTSQATDGIPSPDRAQELQRFEKVLHLWAAAFTLPVLRYLELIEQP